MRKWMIWLGILIILVAAGGGAYYYFFMKEDTEGQASAAALTAQVTRGDIVNQISGTGSVVANSRETVTAGKSGTIATVNFAEGDMVQEGDVIATFEDTDDYDDQIESINDNIEKLQDQILDYQESYKEATGTENEESTKDSIVKSIEDANKEIADYEEDLQDIYEKQAEEVKQIVAPIDGQVMDLSIAVGDEVESNTTVLEIVDYDYLEFMTTVDEIDITSLEVGQTADITLSSFSDRTFAGTVSEIAKEGTSSNGSSSFEVSILLTDKEGVMVGMSGEAAITIDSREDVLVVPVDAVVEVGGKSYVRVPSGTSSGAAASGGASGQGAAAADGSGAAAGGDGGQAAAGADADVDADGSESAEGSQGAPSGEAGQSRPGGEGMPQGEASSEAAQGGQPDGTSGGEASQTAGGAGSQGAAASGGSDAEAQAQGGSSGSRALARIDALGGELVEVTTGLSNETYVEIVSGLEEGQQVLIPSPQGEAGMGEESTTQQQSTFPGGGMGFPSGGGGFGGGGFSGGGMGGGMR